jgi:hypothetical protein
MKHTSSGAMSLIGGAIARLIASRYLDLDVLAGVEALQRLRRVHLGRRAQDHRVETGLFERFGELGRRVRNAVFRRHRLRRLEAAAKGIHVAHLVIDAGVDTEWVRQRMRDAGVDDGRVLLQPSSVADAYWALHQQPGDAWTFETEIRPAGEPW